MRRDNPDRGIADGGGEHLGKPAGRPAALADGEQRADQRAHHVVAERVGDHRGDREAVTVPAPVQDAQGPNIYDTSTVTRQIYEIRALVQSGNSGGPLLSPAGTVDGVVFAAAVGVSDTGFALTANEVSPDASAGANLTSHVSTGACDD